MNLVHPKKWQGPYVQDNIAMQGIEYQVVRTDAGYFIVPGDGVRLPNGQEIGKDLLFDQKTDIALLIQEGGALDFKGKPLAAKIVVGQVAVPQIVNYADVTMADDF